MLPAIVALAHRHPVHALIRPVDGRNPDAPSRLATLLAQPGPAVQDKIARLWGGFVRGGLDRALLNHSGMVPELPPAVPIVDIPHWRINGEATAALVASYAPHLLVAFGAPLLARTIHALPARGSLNVHLGIAPHYRGEHTLFWPLVRGDTDRIGITIHRIDDGIDSGQILAQGFPEIAADDREADVWVKSIELAPRLLPEVVAEEMASAGGQIASTRSSVRGEVFRYRDRTPLADAKYRLRRAFGHARLAPRPGRIVVAPPSP